MLCGDSGGVFVGGLPWYDGFFGFAWGSLWIERYCLLISRDCGLGASPFLILGFLFLGFLSCQRRFCLFGARVW